MDSSAETSCAEEVIIQHILRYVLLEVDTGHSYKDWLSLSLASRNIDKEGQNLAEIDGVPLYPPSLHYTPKRDCCDQAEQRIANDGVAYTFNQFWTYYGNGKDAAWWWCHAKPHICCCRCIHN